MHVKKVKYHKWHQNKRHSFGARLWYKFRYGKYRGLYYGLIWVLFLLFVLPAIESLNPNLIAGISVVFIIVSAAIGFYASYSFVMWIERQLPCTYFGIWMRRVVSSILVMGGFALSFIFMASSVFTMATVSSLGSSHVGFASVFAFSGMIITFFAGTGLFAGYLEYVFEKKSGLLVFFGHQKF